MKKIRLDEVLIEQGLANDKSTAFIMVTEGRVLVNGQKAVSPAQFIEPGAKIEIRSGEKYVGRGAHKLEAALRSFKIDVRGKICADIGSATGGFVEILLKYGAQKVYAIDTAVGKLDLKLREDPRVIVMEGQDVRDLKSLPELVQIVTIDISLIRLENILSRPNAGRFLAKGGIVAALFKPQYETRDPGLLKHGIIKDAASREKLLKNFISWAKKNNWQVEDYIESPIRGSEGNVEYLLYLKI